MRIEKRFRGILITISAIVVLGIVISLTPDMQPLPGGDSTATPESITKAPLADPRLDPAAHQQQTRNAEVHRRFDQAVAMLHAKQYDYAVKALHRVLELEPKMPEAHVNMGYALIGLEQYKAAVDFFDSATALKPMQVNAYYGLALAYEGQKNYLLAVSSMESFIHLAEDGAPYMKKARAAVWEWRGKMKESKDAAIPETMTAADMPETREK